METLLPVVVVGLVVALGVGWITFIVWMVRRSRRVAMAQESVASSFHASLAQLGARQEIAEGHARWTFSHGGRRLEARVRPQSKAPPIYSLAAIVEPVPGAAGAPFRSLPGTPLSRLPPLALRPERTRDRLGKVLGLNREVQTGDPGFDASVYIETEATDEEVERVLASPVVREAVLGLLARGAARVAFADRHGAVVADWSGSVETDPFARGGLDDAARRLAALAEALPAVAAIGSPPAWPRGARWIIATIVALVAGIAAMVAGQKLYQPFDSSLDTRAAMLGVVIASGVTLAAFLALRQTSTALRMISWTLVISMFAFPVLCAGLAELANGALDEPPQTRALQVVDKRMKSGKSTTYYVTFAPFARYTRPVEISVSYSEYSMVIPGARAQVFVGTGALRQPWFGGVVK
jgi:hypothetical protein